jgi:hypothetical protein
MTPAGGSICAHLLYTSSWNNVKWPVYDGICRPFNHSTNQPPPPPPTAAELGRMPVREGTLDISLCEHSPL